MARTRTAGASGRRPVERSKVLSMHRPAIKPVLYGALWLAANINASHSAEHPAPGELPAIGYPTLTDDTPCVNCRYNLRGLPGDGACPECGVPIRASLVELSSPLPHHTRNRRHETLFIIVLIVALLILL